MRIASVWLAICCCLSAASGQWLEKTIGVSDSFGSIQPRAVYYVPGSNCVYAAGDDGVMVVDAATRARVARIELDEPMFMAIDSRDNKIYIGEEESLAVIDPVTHSVISRIWVGGSPYRLTYNPTANKVYCLAGSHLDTLVVVDCNTDSVLACIWVGLNDYPYSGICCNPAGNKVYVSEYDEGEVAVIDGAGDSLLTTVYLGDYPIAPTYSPVSNKVYCADHEDEEVAVIDAGPDTLLKLIELDESPIALGYNPLSNKVYCGDIDGHIHVIDCNTDSLLASLGPIPDNPALFLFDSVDNRVFCFTEYYNSITVISGSGDTIICAIDFVGDVYDQDPACYDPQQNRIYIRGRSSSDLAVLDPARCEITTALPMSFEPLCGYYVKVQDKLYCSDDESGLISVIDCSTDSLERRIFTPGSRLGSPVYSSVSNKLYYPAYLNGDNALLAVDCAHDSFSASLPMNPDGAAAIVYNPVMDRIYWVGNMESTLVVVDCGADTVVARLNLRRYLNGLALNPDSNRLYCASGSNDSMFISAFDCAADSAVGEVFVHTGYSASYRRLMCYVPSRDVVVCAAPDEDVVVIDGKARRLLQTVPLGAVLQLLLDRVTDRLFCLPVGSDDIAIIDCRDMSIQARVRLAARPDDIALDSVANRLWATSPDFGCISLVDGRTNDLLGLVDAGQSPGDITWAPQHRRMYVVDQRGEAVLVFRDTSAAGISGASALSQTRTIPTVVRGLLNLQPAICNLKSEIALISVDGRKVLDLHPGANDVRALAPGVYFVLPKQSAAAHQPSAVTKVVITK